MLALIIAGAVAYIAVGLILAGFLDISISVDAPAFFAVVLLWLAVLVVFVVIMIGMAPIHLGKRLSAKYLTSFEDFVNKLFNN